MGTKQLYFDNKLDLKNPADSIDRLYQSLDRKELQIKSIHLFSVKHKTYPLKAKGQLDEHACMCMDACKCAC